MNNRIALIDVDGHHFPNLALMRISAWHKAQGDTVEWWREDAHYSTCYMSKIFSAAYSPDIPNPKNANAVVRGGPATVSLWERMAGSTLIRLSIILFRMR